MSRKDIRFSFVALFIALILFTVSAFAASPRRGAAEAKTVDEALFQSLTWREVGPYRGGRSAAVEGIRTQPLVYYFGSTGGGVWKTTNGGESWTNVSDGWFGGSIGAIAVSDWDPNIVYVGGGEETVRGNVSHGNGMWKSMDAGKSWTHVGLDDSRHISRIRIHPRDPEIVYAAVMGHLFGPNDMRGVYRTGDGGKSWKRILFVNHDAGSVDLVLDPSNPRIIYASTWRARRTPSSFESGGAGSALWKSTDGGDTWIELTRNPGMPKGTIGKIGITVSGSNPQNLYAIVEAEKGGVFRSRDAGETWTQTNESRDLRQRAWYYTRIYADPKDEDAVYVLNVRFHKSKDGGKTFETIRTPHGDNHDLWVAPDDPLRMIESNDGGANVTTDGGATWTSQDNQPTAQFYRISTDNSFPYRLLGGQQDNSAVRIRHRSTGPGIGERDWEPTAGGESGHIVAKPDDPDVVYGGSYGGYLTMANHRTDEFRDVNPWPDNPMGWGAAELEHRFQWNFPILFSPHDPNLMYAASQYLLKSTDAGASWTRISGDLTRDDKKRMGPSGGPITKDNTSVEYYGTIFAVAESPIAPGLLWVGSDDGLLHVSLDGGANWTNVTPKQMPEWIMINCIDPSPFDPATAYVAATMYKSDDFRPYLFRTNDYGKTWTKIDRGIDSTHFTRAIRADPKRKGLLYAGTEMGVYVSIDEGANWQPLQLELPITPITDLAVRDDDLIAATQGRGFWILDDLTVLHQLSAEIAAKNAHLFAPRATWRIQAYSGWRAPRNQGTNPPNGVLVHYWISKVDRGTPVSLAFLDGEGNVIREFKGEVEEKKEDAKPVPMDRGREEEAVEEIGEKEAKSEKKKEDKLEKVVPGMNRFAWNLRAADAKDFDGLIMWSGSVDGPRVPPGTYEVRLTVGETTMTSPFALNADPRSSATQEDLEAQYGFLIGIRDKLTEIHEEIGTIRKVRAQLDDLKKRIGDDESTKPVVEAAKSLDERMTAVEEALYQTRNRSSQDPLNFPIRLNDKLAGVGESASTGDFAPTAQQIAVRDRLFVQIDEQLEKIKAVWESDLGEFNRVASVASVPAVIVERKSKD